MMRTGNLEGEVCASPAALPNGGGVTTSSGESHLH
jgi:hypothetical protein